MASERHAITRDTFWCKVIVANLNHLITVVFVTRQWRSFLIGPPCCNYNTGLLFCSALLSADDGYGGKAESESVGVINISAGVLVVSRETISGNAE